METQFHLPKNQSLPNRPGYFFRRRSFFDDRCVTCCSTNYPAKYWKLQSSRQNLPWSSGDIHKKQPKGNLQLSKNYIKFFQNQNALYIQRCWLIFIWLSLFRLTHLPKHCGCLVAIIWAWSLIEHGMTWCERTLLIFAFMMITTGILA